MDVHDQRRVFVDAERQVTVFNMGWRNDAPFRKQTETTPFLNSGRRGAKCVGRFQSTWKQVVMHKKPAAPAPYRALATHGLSLQKVCAWTAWRNYADCFLSARLLLLSFSPWSISARMSPGQKTLHVLDPILKELRTLLPKQSTNNSRSVRLMLAPLASFARKSIPETEN